MINAKIIATLGPSSNTKSVIKKMHTDTFDIVRLNFSHGTCEEHIRRIKIIRDINRETGWDIKIMQDLEGYRIRIGKLKKPMQLKKNSIVYVTNEDIIGDMDKVSFDYKGPIESIKQKDLIYIDDGKIILEVLKVKQRNLKTKVIAGGILKENKGINIPELKLDFKTLTEKDRKDVKVGINYRLDYIAQSFVRCGNDVKELKDIVKPKHKKCKIFAKIESSQAINNIEEIIDEADGIIIARGDLGISVPIYKVPVLQKEIIKKTRLKNKPAVVATQMLDSMVEENIPTRAEVSDVANAILDGASFLLLSAETAVGSNPPEVVKMMDNIIKYTQEYQSLKKRR